MKKNKDKSRTTGAFSISLLSKTGKRLGEQHFENGEQLAKYYERQHPKQAKLNYKIADAHQDVYRPTKSTTGSIQNRISRLENYGIIDHVRDGRLSEGQNKYLKGLHSGAQNFSTEKLETEAYKRGFEDATNTQEENPYDKTKETDSWHDWERGYRVGRKSLKQETNNE